MTDRSFVVAVDGPAASGKGTISKRLAARFDLAHLDTGLLYRATAARGLEAGVDLSDADAAAAIAASLGPQDMERADIRSSSVGAASSIVAAHPQVRAALLAYQQDFARAPNGGAIGAVLDGRDIGTAVCPNADVKLFVTASLEERARRRHRDLIARGESAAFEAVRADLEARDQRDSARTAAPMKPADGAYLLDTTEMAIDAAVSAAAEIIERCLSTRRAS